MLEKLSLEQVIRQMDPSAKLEDSAREVLTKFMDDYVNEVLQKSCELARHRKSTRLESKDVVYAIEHFFQEKSPIALLMQLKNKT